MAKTNGPTLPGLRTPGGRTPGKDVPDRKFGATNEQSDTGIAVDSTGTTTLGTTDEIEGVLEYVTVTATAADFNFNINVDGNAVFASAQSPSGTTEERFNVADEVDEAFFRGDAGVDIVFEVTSASGTGGATADVTASVESEEQR